MQPEWTKVCGTDPATKKEICYTTRDFGAAAKEGDAPQPLLALAVYDPKADDTKIIRLLLPPGLMLKPGFRFSIDKGPVETGAFEICFPNGCFAEAKVKKAVVDGMKKAEKMMVVVKNQANAEVTFYLPMTDFGKAFDGPAVDPKVLEEQQKKLQEELQKKAEEERKKLEAKGAAPPPPLRRSKAQAVNQQKRPRDERGRFFNFRAWNDADLSGRGRRVWRSVPLRRAHPVAAVLVALEGLLDLRMADGIAGGVGHEVLLRHIGDIFGFGVFSEEMVERLVLARTQLFGNRQPPFLGVGEHRIDVIDDAPEGVSAVLHHLPDPEFGPTLSRHSCDALQRVFTHAFGSAAPPPASTAALWRSAQPPRGLSRSAPRRRAASCLRAIRGRRRRPSRHRRTPVAAWA